MTVNGMPAEPRLSEVVFGVPSGELVDWRRQRNLPVVSRLAGR